jgi:hypothetical protein
VPAFETAGLNINCLPVDLYAKCWVGLVCLLLVVVVSLFVRCILVGSGGVLISG